VTLCVAADDQGNVITSTDPGAAVPTWTVTDVDGSNQFSGVSCPSVALCVAVDQQGNAVVSTDPSGGSGAWTVTSIDPIPLGYIAPLESVACPSISLCVAVDMGGTVVSSVDPTGGSTQWTKSAVLPRPNPTDITCPSVTLCVVINNSAVITSTDPTGGSGSWRIEDAERTSQNLRSVSCPSATFCVSGGTGIIAFSLNSSGGVHEFSQRAAPPGSAPITRFACLSETQCAAVDSQGGVLYSTNPQGLWNLQLTESEFPFKQQPKVIASMSSTGSYSFSVHPTVATRYTVTKTGPGAAGHVVTPTIYVAPTAQFGRGSRCRTKPTCRMTWNFTYRIPTRVSVSETAKPWHLYLRVNVGSTGLVGPWHRDTGATYREIKIGAGHYRVRMAFTVRVGSGTYAFEWAVCRKQTESRNGFDFPGNDPCGRTTVPALYFG
jgi:hypothetical protein